MKQRPIPQIPEPQLKLVHNLTPFPHFQCDKMGVGRKFYDTVVVKGTFKLQPGRLELADVQAPIALADDYWDLTAPERSSVKQAGDVVLFKPSTDVIITGSVRSPTGDPMRDWDTAVVVQNESGTILNYSAHVTGPRHWRYSSIRGWVLSEPEPTTEVPIRYELAYGGAYLDRRESSQVNGKQKWIVHKPNPSGTGFSDESAMDRSLNYRAPRWQPRLQPVTSVNCDIPLTGFGPISRPWSARLKYAGTYDDDWFKSMRIDTQQGLPADYAADFDPRFFQCAHPSLIVPDYLQGSESIGLGGVLPGHSELVVHLPGVALQSILLDSHGNQEEKPLLLDTIHLDIDAALVYLCWRLTLNQEREVNEAIIYGIEER